MPERLTVSSAGEREELRQWALAMADLHEVWGTIAEDAPAFVPGQHVAALRAAWARSAAALDRVVWALDPGADGAAKTLPEEWAEPSPPAHVAFADLRRAELHGESGSLKRSVLAGWRDWFFGSYRETPRTEEQIQRAAAAAAHQADLGAVALDSLGSASSEIPGLATVCKVAEEGLLVGRQLLAMRWRI